MKTLTYGAALAMFAGTADAASFTGKAKQKINEVNEAAKNAKGKTLHIHIGSFCKLSTIGFTGSPSNHYGEIETNLLNTKVQGDIGFRNVLVVNQNGRVGILGNGETILDVKKGWPDNGINTDNLFIKNPSGETFKIKALVTREDFDKFPNNCYVM